MSERQWSFNAAYWRARAAAARGEAAKCATDGERSFLDRIAAQYEKLAALSEAVTRPIAS